MYDPKKHGAKCDECPLKHQKPVAPKLTKSNLVILYESPATPELAIEQKFMGGSAAYRLRSSFQRNGYDFSSFSQNAAVLCYHTKLSPADRKQAIACCQPRLKKEIKEHQTILALGAEAFETSTGHTKVDPWMGTPLPSTLHQGQVFGTRSPLNLFANPAFLPVFEAHIARAAALAHDRLSAFRWPQLVVGTGPEVSSALQTVLEANKAGEPVAIDIESRPSTGAIRCIGIGTRTLCVTVPFEGVQNQLDHAALHAILECEGPKVFQNAAFDLPELSEAGFVVKGRIYDTLLMHAVAAPRLPHDLSSMMAFETTAERWKTLFKVESDDKGKALTRFDRAELTELMTYNAKDVAATIFLYHRFHDRLNRMHRGQELSAQLHQLSNIAMKMKAWGITVAKENFEGHRKNLGEILTKLEAKFTQMVTAGGNTEPPRLGKGGIHISQQKFFFEKHGVPIVARNEDGRPQLNSEALVTYTSMLAETHPPMAELARVIYQYRKHAKLLGSYIENLPVAEDGRVHPAWRVFGTRTGRWSATDPGIQTIPKKSKKAGTPSMRDLFCSRPGFVMLEADYSQLELRIVAVLSGDEKLLDWYAQGLDVHTMNAREIFQTKTPTDAQRDLAKRVVYGMNYGGSAKTIWRSLTADIPVQLEIVEMVVAGWFKAHPKIKTWQDSLVEEAQKLLHVEEPLSGRRQYYYDGRVRPTEVLNFPVQGAAGELANRAVIAIADQMDWETMALIAQVHDSTMTEAIVEKQAKLVEIVRGAMEQEITINGASIRFPIDLKVGTNWGNMEKLKL